MHTFVHQVSELEDPGAVYRECMRMIAQLASWGLVHCDFNEFNLLVRFVDEWGLTGTNHAPRSTKTATSRASTFRKWCRPAIPMLKNFLRGTWAASTGMLSHAAGLDCSVQ